MLKPGEFGRGLGGRLPGASPPTRALVTCRDASAAPVLECRWRGEPRVSQQGWKAETLEMKSMARLSYSK